MKLPLKTLFCLSLFATAMGFLESAVVIYLREIYYQEGFDFPLTPMSPTISLVEIFREVATIIMLLGIAYLAGKTKLQRFAYFTFAFAIWDIFYYVFLYIFLGWPQSLFTWDILFLIPVPWVGPVIAPVLISFLMIIGSVSVIAKVHQNHHYGVKSRDMFLLLLGALVCIASFIWDYLFNTTFRYTSTKNYSEQLITTMQHYIPLSFNYPLFFVGFSLMTFSVVKNLPKPENTKSYEKK